MKNFGCLKIFILFCALGSGSALLGADKSRTLRDVHLDLSTFEDLHDFSRRKGKKLECAHRLFKEAKTYLRAISIYDQNQLRSAKASLLLQQIEGFENAHQIITKVKAVAGGLGNFLDTDWAVALLAHKAREEEEKYDLDLKGLYQTKNILGVLDVLEILKETGYWIEQEHIKNGLKNVIADDKRIDNSFFIGAPLINFNITCELFP